MDQQHVFAELRKVRTPIIYDTVEQFNLRPRTEGLMDTSVKALLPGLGPIVGYACTAKVVGALPQAAGERCVESRDVWNYVEQARHPSVMVIQDLDQPPARSCAWGDVAASIFLRLGCVGAVTNGGVRDLPDVEELGFQLCAPSPVVGHAHIRWVEIDTPVTVGSLVVYPGDLIHADEHGVMTIPAEIDLEKLLEFIDKFLASEKTIVDYCQQDGFDLDQLCEIVDQHETRVSGHLK
ncbi:MAG: RraA family protein [Pirellulaceae bacterium]|nr:RraA family protein [Pirellulaceae bacterium]